MNLSTPQLTKPRIKMRNTYKALLILPLLAFATTPAHAQSWKWDFGVNAGYAKYTPALGADNTGLGSAAGADVHWKAGAIFGTQLGYNFTPKLGLRLNGRYADRPLVGSSLENSGFVTSTNLWTATADMLFRLKAPAPEFTKMEMLPYVAVGLGAKWHNGAGDNFTCTDSKASFNCSPFVTGLPTKPRGFAMGEENTLAGLLGLGADWRVARSFAIRTELSDVVYKPQFHTATVPAAGTNWAVSDVGVAKVVNEIGAQVGLHFLFGVARPPVVAIAPLPIAPPVTTPKVAPMAMEPRRESINVCVIDPSLPSGIRMQTATLIEGRDTVVTLNGTDRPFRESVGMAKVAGTSDWYIQGRPLSLTVGTTKTEFTTYGSARVIDPSELVFVGSVDGFPVYADKADTTNPATALNDAKVLYVPLTNSGCVFQAVQRQDEVRKSRK
jgi:hypothetical protein